MVSVLVLCFVFLVNIYSPISCHSQNEGYFIYHSSTNEKASVIPNNMLTTKVMRRILCAQLCVGTMKCNGYFYRYLTGDCVLHTKTIDPKGSRTDHDWVYMLRKTPYEDEKTPIVLFFANHAARNPYYLNLNKFDWKSYSLDNYDFTMSKGSGFYDKETKSLITTDKTGDLTEIKVTTISSFEDIENPQIKEYVKVTGAGVSFDSIRRRIFFLKARNINTISMKTKEISKYATLYGGFFTSQCRTAYSEKHKTVYTHFGQTKNLYAVTNNRKRRKVPLPNMIVNLEHDVKGDRLVYLPGYSEVWEIPLATLKPSVLMGKKAYNSVFPLEDSLLVSVPSDGGYFLQSRDGKRLIRKIQWIEQCKPTVGACEETFIVRLDL